ncbi:MAG: class I SAM-dependent methyltransferase [bacterium]|nr:class I SAM-dependent methyltransferase [bacterium]
MRNLKYKPTSPIEHPLISKEDVAKMRAYYFNEDSSNLKFLLEKRYGWMNNFIKNDDIGVEFGSGTGFSKLFIKCRNFKITDINDYEWLDESGIDVTNSPYQSNSLDFVLVSNLIYTLPIPQLFFKEMERILRPGGVVIIHEVNASWSMRRIVKVRKHEGYDFTYKAFENATTHSHANNSINIAIPRLLFDHKNIFESKVPAFKIVYSGFSEFLILLNSGGLSTQTKFLRLPRFLLKLVNKVDKILIKITPQTFALQRQIVIQKK